VKKAVIFDLDGTLADCTHRLHHVTNGRKDWDAFFAGIAGDTLVEPIADLTDMAGMWDAAVILCSGRPEKCRATTTAWLGENRIEYDRLYMRPDADMRPDHVVKRQILDGIRADGYEPFLVIDDRESVVRMWRDEGLVCLQASVERPTAGTALLTIMVGPSGAGKSSWIQANVPASQVVSSDATRADLCGDFRDQTRNDDVFAALHSVVRARLRAGLPTTIDATNIRRKDRIACAELAAGGPVRYVVIDRPMDQKRRDGGWRNEIVSNGEPFDLIGKHDQTFRSQIKDILSGDGLPNVEVIDVRQ
jgi:predicted kinase